MRDLLAGSSTAVGEDGIEHHFHYFTVVGAMDVGGRFACESYGVKVQEDGGDTVTIPNITVCTTRIEQLLELLRRCTVGPTSVGDVVADWL